MRCPHCRGEIPPESQFCGVCGQNIHVAPARSKGLVAGAGADVGASSASLFELPVSKGARLVRSGMILGLNLLLLGGGLALTFEYLHKRERAATGELSGALGGQAPDDLAGGELALAKVLVDAGAPGSEDGQETEASSESFSESPAAASDRAERGSASSPPPDRRADAGAAADKPVREREPPARAQVDAGRASGNPGRADAGAIGAEPPSPEEEARRVRVLSAQISLVVKSHQGQLTRCYESASKITTPDKPIVGRIDVRFSVQGDGSATSVRTSANNTGSAGLENCLLALVRSWTFPASGGEALDFVWPFEFQAP